MSPRLILVVVPFFILTFVGEAWLRKRKGMPFDVTDGKVSVLSGVGFLVINLLLHGGMVGLMTILYEHRLFELGSSWPIWALALVADDFSFYWAHRLSHEIRFFWATHEAHHSSEQYTLTTALRQPWTEPLAFVFWLPMPLLGFSPAMVLFAHTVSLVYQYGIHTELVGKLGPLEWIFNTPSHHRVHHGSNARYVDKNHGGILIVWDRLFGTFQVEDEAPAYGLVTKLDRNEVVHVAFHEWKKIARDVRAARTMRGRFTALFGRTGTDYLACERVAILPRPDADRASLDAAE
jgi:sterol desaturase/sphingolipid hydroxylase (fatty acid hydroxylase superfamily)